MDRTTVIQKKMSKVESSLKELQDEILSATKYLFELSKNSATIVKNLNSITSTTTYLEEFLTVNAFLMKSIKCVTEFNCELELLGMTDKSLSKFLFSNKSSVENTKSSNESEKESSNDGSVQEGLDKGNVGEDVTEPEPKKGQGGKKKKTKSEKSLSVKDKNNSDSAVNVAAPVNVDNTHSILKACEDNNNSSHITEQNSNSVVQPKLQNSSDTVNDIKESVPVEKVDPQFCIGENKSNSSISEIYLSTNSSLVGSDKTTKQTPIVDSSNSSVDNLCVNSSSAKIACDSTQSSGNIPVAEVVPTKIRGRNLDGSECNSSNDLDFTKSAQSFLGNEFEGDFKNEGELDEIQPAKIVRTVGKEYDVVIEYIKSPSEFYVSIIDGETNLLMELEKELSQIPASKYTSHNKRNKITKARLSGEIGKHCLVYSRCDEMWWRAKITNWGFGYDDEFVNVFLLDYGESKCVSIYDLQAMPKHLREYPAFTVRCHLHDVFPVGMDKKNSKLLWEKESTEEMKSLTEESKKVRIRVAPEDAFHPAVSLPVTLWLIDQDNTCINKLLVQKKCATDASDLKETEKKSEIFDKSTHEIVDSCNGEDSGLSNWNPMKEDYESYKNSYDLDAKDPSAIIYGYVGKDYERICRHFAKNGYCFKGGSCRKEHKKLDPLGFTTDQEEVFQSAINSLSVPPNNSKLNIQVTYLLTCSKFFCFMESHNVLPSEETLESLLQFMNKKENILQMKKLLIPPSAGQIVIARYSVDRAWYRARVLESQPENDQYIIVFVDYGNKETLRLSEIRAIEARYLHLPFQAIQCSIFGIEQNPEFPSKEVMDYMKEKMCDGQLTIEVIARLPGENINLLVNVFNRDGVSIAEDLIAKNYAICKNELLISSSSESVPG